MCMYLGWGVEVVPWETVSRIYFYELGPQLYEPIKIKRFWFLDDLSISSSSEIILTFRTCQSEMKVNSLQKSNRILEWSTASSVYSVCRCPNQEHTELQACMRPCRTQDQWPQAAKSGLRSGLARLSSWGHWEAFENNNREAELSLVTRELGQELSQETEGRVVVQCFLWCLRLFLLYPLQCGSFHSRGIGKAPLSSDTLCDREQLSFHVWMEY